MATTPTIPVPPGLESSIYDSPFVKEVDFDGIKRRGRLTRRLDPSIREVRDVIVFSGIREMDCLLTDVQRNELQSLRRDLDAIADYKRVGRVTAVKDYLAALKPQSNIVPAVLKHGPVPTYRFGAFEGFDLSLFPSNRFYARLHSTIPSGDKNPKELSVRLNSYRIAGLAALYAHYLENIAVRFRDIRWHRSEARALRECNLILDQDYTSITSKLSDHDASAQCNDPDVAKAVSEIDAAEPDAHVTGRYGVAMALLLVDELRNVFRIFRLFRPTDIPFKREVPYRDLLRRLKRNHETLIEADSSLKLLKHCHDALEDRSPIRVPEDGPSEWAIEFARFANFLQEVRKDAGALASNPFQGLRTSIYFSSPYCDGTHAGYAEQAVAIEAHTVGVFKSNPIDNAPMQSKAFLSDLFCAYAPDFNRHNVESSAHDQVIRELRHAQVAEKNALLSYETAADHAVLPGALPRPYPSHPSGDPRLAGLIGIHPFEGAMVGAPGDAARIRELKKKRLISVFAGFLALHSRDMAELLQIILRGKNSGSLSKEALRSELQSRLGWPSNEDKEKKAADKLFRRLLSEVKRKKFFLDIDRVRHDLVRSHQGRYESRLFQVVQAVDPDLNLDPAEREQFLHAVFQHYAKISMSA